MGKPYFWNFRFFPKRVGDFSALKKFFFWLFLLLENFVHVMKVLTEGHVSARTLVCHWIWELEGILDSAIRTVAILEMEKTKCRKGSPCTAGQMEKGRRCFLTLGCSDSHTFLSQILAWSFPTALLPCCFLQTLLMLLKPGLSFFNWS